MEQEPISFEPIEPNFSHPSHPSRRDFLRAATTAAVAAALLAEEEPAEAKETIDTRMDEISDQSVQEEIEFPDKPEALTKEAKEVILACARYQKDWFARAGLGAESRESLVQRTTPEISRQGKEQLFNELKRHLPDIGDFSEENLNHAVLYKLPRYCASFGILVMPDYHLSTQPDLSRFTGSELILCFYQIEKITREEVARDGQRFTRKILDISGPLTIDGEEVNARDAFMSAPGVSIFGNIVIYQPKIQSITETLQDKKVDAIAERINSTPIPLLEQKIVTASNRASALTSTAAGKIWHQMRGKNQTAEQILTTLRAGYIEHETDHLLKNRGSTAVFAPKRTSNPREFMANRANRQTHNEISALLFEMRNYADPSICLMDAVSSFEPGIQQDFEHDRSLRYIIENMVSLISASPENYGLEIRKDSSLNKRNQIFIQLHKLLKKPALIAQLAKAVEKEHDSNPDEDFSPEFFADPELQSKMRLGQEHNRQEAARIRAMYGAGAVGTAIIVGGGTILLRNFFRRKSEGTKRKEEKKEKRKVKKKK